jgi:twitching motility protein PilT
MADPASRLETLLELCEELQASDLHISGGLPPYVRRQGELTPLAEPALGHAEVEALARTLMHARQWETFLERQSIDLAHTSRGGRRFRVNAYREQGAVALALRRLRDDFLEFDDWGLPEELGELCALHDGLVLVTGPTGSGKTTTLATLVHRVNTTRQAHVVTVEDPVEFVHRSRRALVHQRELHVDVPSFAEAVRAALREDPDVILIGEMRDLDTMRAALVAAETGHLVLSTLHTADAVGSVERMLGSFPAQEQDSVRHQLSMVLRAVVAQKLLPRADGTARVPVLELLKVTTAVANLVRTGRFEQIYSVLETGTAHGMRTFDRELARLVREGVLGERLARSHARSLRAFDEGLALGAAPAHPRTRRAR